MGNTITLYKNCKITADYFFVLDNKFLYEKNGITKTAFLHYLDTLYQVSYTTSDFYLVETGKLNIPFTGDVSDIYSYNYMKITTDKTQDCYAEKFYFITDMVQNSFSTVTALYTEDKWGNYSDKIHLFPSYLERKKHVFNGSLYNPAIAYNSNKPFIFRALKTGFRYKILVNYQFFNMSTQGEITNREIGSALIGIDDPDLQLETPYISNINNVLDLINNIMISSSTVRLSDQRYYEVTKISILPDYIRLNTRQIGDKYIIINNIKYYFMSIFTGYEETELTDIEEFENINFKSDFKITGIGVYSFQIPLLINGKDKQIKLLLYKYASEVKIFLSLDGSLYDFTDYFEYKYPVSIDNATTTQQQKIAQKLNETLLENQKTQATIMGVLSGVNLGIGALSIGMGSKYDDQNLVRGGYNYIMAGEQGIVNSVIAVQNADAKLKAIKSAQYTSNKSYVTSSDNLINSVYGFGYTTLEPINEFIVNEDILLNGYSLFEVHDDDVFDNSYTDDVIKFNSAKVYGNVTQSIIKWFNNLFTNGIRIYYDDTQV